MNAKKLLTALAFASVVLISGCAKDDFVEIPGVCPIVVSTIPVNKATGVPLNQIIYAKFNDRMNASSITSSSFFIQQANTLIAGSISHTDSTAIFTPSANLSPNTIYTGTVTTLVKNTKGLFMQENYVWTFTTIPQLLLFSNPVEGGDTSGAGTFVNGASVTAVATPNPGYTFFNWSENGVIIPGAEANYTFIMDGNRTLIANFTANTFTLDVTAVNGSVTKNPDQLTYNDGDIVELKAIADPNYEFTGWSGDASGSIDTVSITMDADKNVVANFTAIAIVFTLDVTAVNGSVTKNPDQLTYNDGDIVELKAIADPNYEFTGWSGDASGSIDTVSITMDADKNVVANFAIKTYTLQVTAVNGSVTKNPDQATYNSGTDVELIASADPGFEFTGWSGDASGSIDTVSITMDANKSVVANFSLIVVPPVVCTPVINLGLAGDYAILAESAITATPGGPTSITGDMGISPFAATSITGFDLILDSSGTFSTSGSTSNLVTGKIYAADYTLPTPTNVGTAVGNMLTAFTVGNGLPSTVTEYMGGNLNATQPALAPGVYKWGTDVLITDGITLDGGGDSCASWVFQIDQKLIVANGAIIHLQNGAEAKNIFWLVSGSGATLGTTVQFEGNILSATLIDLQTGASVNGRLLAQTAVTLDANTVVKPQ